jgi:hypothetical protein
MARFFSSDATIESIGARIFCSVFVPRPAV